MKKLLFSLFAIAALCVSFTACKQEVEAPAEVGSIYGVVSNSETGEPIQGVAVTLSPSNLTTVTGNDGHYEFVEVEAGQYKIFCQANGFEPNYKPITVKAGFASTADVILTPESETSGIRISTNTLDFGSQYTELTLEITNISTSGNIMWNASETASWLTISPTAGTLSMGGTDVIIAKVDRSALTTDDMTFIKITAAGITKTITVLVSKGDNSGDNGENGSTGDGGTVKEDYSTATVESCDYRIDTKIISCKRNGTSVLFTYMLTNNSFGDCDDFRIVGPARMGSRTTIYDNEGNQYEYNIMMTFGSKKNGSSHILNGPFLEGVPYQCSFDVPNVPASATHMSFKIEVEAYAHVNDCGSDFVNFLNVPIY